jgi:protein-S-isoprenylcysteine O-methyltransferase Ste14
VLAFVVAWISWALPFIRQRRQPRASPSQVDPRARLGILAEAIGFGTVFMHQPITWGTPLPVWRAALGATFALAGITLSWSAVRHLGKQWRFDAALRSDHDLIQTGPYALVRHPIYASMLLMFGTAAAWIGTLPGWPVGLAFFLVGTEIRVRVEDSLLSRRFADRFTAWQRAVPAYIPFIR